MVLTTNFDPLIEVGIRKAGGDYFRTALATDGNLLAGAGTVPHVVHLHGYWYGGETLHTPAQLTRPRPLLESSLRTLLRDKTIVVAGYGGWDDVFTRIERYWISFKTPTTARTSFGLSTTIGRPQSDAIEL